MKRAGDRHGSEWWVAGLWTKSNEGFVEVLTLIEAVGEFAGRSREMALVEMREKLEREREGNM